MCFLFVKIYKQSRSDFVARSTRKYQMTQHSCRNPAAVFGATLSYRVAAQAIQGDSPSTPSISNGCICECRPDDVYKDLLVQQKRCGRLHLPSPSSWRLFFTFACVGQKEKRFFSNDKHHVCFGAEIVGKIMLA